MPWILPSLPVLGLIAMAIAPIFFWGLQWLGQIAAYSYGPERGQVE